MFYHIYQRNSSKEIYCYNLETEESLDENEINKLLQIIGIKKSYTNFYKKDYIEYGPHLFMITPWCSNALSILYKCFLKKIIRIERSILVERSVFVEDMVDRMTETVYLSPIETFKIVSNKVPNKPYLVYNIEEENVDKKLGFDEYDIEYYKGLFEKMNKVPNNVELYDLSQSNSEHSRHWFFNGKFVKDGKELDSSLMDMIKSTQNMLRYNVSLIAFSDNSSAIRGNDISVLTPNIKNQFVLDERLYHPVLTAETHNFPTSIAPFQGATTGTGGRIRDNQSIGRGGLCIGGIAGYSVGNIDDGDYKERNVKILIEGSNGASDYGNKFGEPVIGGFCRSFGMTMDNNDRIEYVKPIMFSAGIGQMDDKHLLKETELSSGILVVRLGGPCLRIGIGGGSASSREQKMDNMEEDYNAVQRGDPEMGNRLNRVIRACVEMGDANPILSIHDQGAGGMANVTKEIVNPNGARINLNNVIIGDDTMSVMEIWVSEHQEQDTVLIDPKSVELMERICIRENLPMAIIGDIDNSGKMVVEYNDETVVEFDLESILGKDIPRKIYELCRQNNRSLISNKTVPDFNNPNNPNNFNNKYTFVLEKMLKSISICSKRFLVNKVDRSVSGLIAQQQCCGPLQIPLVDYSLVAQSYYNLFGIVSSVGERPTIGLIDTKAMARMTIGEMLTNMMFCCIDDFHNIRCSGNWMWAMKQEGEKEKLYDAVKTMTECMSELGIALDGGKDSLSMTYHDKAKDRTIKSLGTLVITGYTTTSDIRKKVTPDFKKDGNIVYYLNLSNGKYRLGGSSYYQEQGIIGDECPNFINTKKFRKYFNSIQSLVKDGVILSGHDVSDGGLIVTLLEMCFAGNKGFVGNVNITVDGERFLNNEELGVIFEVNKVHKSVVEELFMDDCHLLGRLVNEDIFEFIVNDYLIKNRVTNFRNYWENTSMKMDFIQTNKECVKMEYDIYKNWKNVPTEYEIYTDKALQILETDNNINYRPKIVIIREEGSNGDREMASIFYDVGFDVYDYTMNDLLDNDEINFDEYRGMIFVGGFSYSDVFGAGRGWYSVIMNNDRIKCMFDKFYQREDTFSLGICNGCQLMSLLNWIPQCSLVTNDSGRFESRFSRVRINKNNSIMLKNMEECILGIWTAHGEGKFLLTETISSIPIQYVDHNNLMTQVYPYNPNGSELAIAGLCSNNGRHLAMMPHPERCYIEWQKPIYNNRGGDRKSGWYIMFKNAYDWCIEYQK